MRNITLREMATSLAVFLLVLGACSKTVTVRDNVLEPGESVEATNRFGTVRVTYVSPTSRRYRWDKTVRTVEMIVRQERFLGALGLYDPASQSSDHGPVRLVTQESKLNFASYDEIYRFLHQSKDLEDWVYTKDGLTVGFGRTPERNQINVDVWQILINGQKPRDLIGARDANIRMESVR
jgi:hypothetical protein